MEIGTQVMIRSPIAGRLNRIQWGRIISLDGEKALVAIQDDPKKPLSMQASSKRSINVKQLTPVNEIYAGRNVVQSNPLHRTIASHIFLAGDRRDRRDFKKVK